MSSDSWAILGRGAANAILVQEGDVSEVVRVRHQAAGAGSPEPTLQTLRDLVWGPQQDGAGSFAFIEQHIRPCLSTYIAAGETRAISPGMLAALLEAGLTATCDEATRLPNFVRLPVEPDLGRGACLAIEIKPKCGFLPSCSTLHPSHHLKRRIPRYQLHQALKLAQGVTAKRSLYNPCDLFSGAPSRVATALRCLLACPQNNCKAFVDGAPVPLLAAPAAVRPVSPPGDPVGRGQAALGSGQADARPGGERQRVALESGEPASVALGDLSEPVQRALQDLFPASATSQRLQLFVAALQEILAAEAMLDGILHLQRLDRFDVEAVQPLCQHALHHLGHCTGSPPAADMMCASPSTCPWFQSWAAAGAETAVGPGSEHAHDENVALWRSAHEALAAQPWADVAHCVRDYLVAVTAKDCAVIVTMQRTSPPPLDGPPTNVLGERRDGEHAVSIDGPGTQTCSGQELACLSEGVCVVDRKQGPVGVGATGASCGEMRVGRGRVRYRVAVVDLDQKPLTSIAKHHRLDCDIMRHWRSIRDPHSCAGV